MSDRVYVTEEDELGPGERMIVTAEGKSIGVFNVDGEYYAIENNCAHEHGPICEGKVQGTLEGEWSGPGERVTERFTDEPAIACPWHGWEFDLEEGTHLGDDSISIPTYDVIVEGGTIYIKI